MAFKLLVCLLFFRSIDGATLGEGQMGMTELIQMRNDLEDRLKSGVRINSTENSTWQLFKTLFQNTTIPYINSEFTDIGSALNNSWGEVTGCYNTLKQSKNSTWDSNSNDKNTKFTAHEDCRKAQPDPTCNKTCTRCKAWVEDLLTGGDESSRTTAPPSGSIRDGNADRVPVFNNCSTSDCWGDFGKAVHNDTLTDWFKRYHDWHCTEDDKCPDGVSAMQNLKPHDCWVNCTYRCTEEVGEWNNNVSTCDGLQDQFEDALCTLTNAMTSDCSTYATCRTGDGQNQSGADADYRAEKVRVRALETVLQAEYQMVQSIICLIELLLTPETTAIADSDIENCARYWDTPCPSLALCIPEVPKWDEYVNCECNNFPNNATCTCNDNVNPGWCDTSECSTGNITGNTCSYGDRFPSLANCTEFVQKYYHGRSWYNATGDCDAEDVVTKVVTKACTAARATANGGCDR